MRLYGCEYQPKLHQIKLRTQAEALVASGNTYGRGPRRHRAAGQAAPAMNVAVRASSVARTTAQDRHAETISKTHDLAGDLESSPDARQGGGRERTPTPSLHSPTTASPLCRPAPQIRMPLLDWPVKTNQIPRHVPPAPLAANPTLLFLAAGVLPFGTMFIELYFAMTSLWLGYFYYLFGFVLLIGALTCIINAEISVLCTYVQLCAEDYHWWWVACVFWRGGKGRGGD